MGPPAEIPRSSTGWVTRNLRTGTQTVAGRPSLAGTELRSVGSILRTRDFGDPQGTTSQDSIAQREPSGNPEAPWLTGEVTSQKQSGAGSDGWLQCKCERCVELAATGSDVIVA